MEAATLQQSTERQSDEEEGAVGAVPRRRDPSRVLRSIPDDKATMKSQQAIETFLAFKTRADWLMLFHSKARKSSITPLDLINQHSQVAPTNKRH